MARRRKILADHGRIDYEPSKSFNFDDETWAALIELTPASLEADTGVRREIEHVCAFVIGYEKVNRIGDGAASAAVTPGGNAKRVPLKRLVAALQEAQQAWQQMRAAGFRSSAIMGADSIEQIAARAQALLDGLPDARVPVEVWPILVRRVHAAFRGAGYKPGVTKRFYGEGGRPTWFQQFMSALNGRLPDGVSRPTASPEALYSAVADALAVPGCTEEEKKLIEAVEGLATLRKELVAQQSGEK